MTIVEFLNARLNEYEAALTDATSGPPFSPIWTSGGAAVDAVLSRADVYDIDERVVWLRRDLEAKRRIVAELEEYWEEAHLTTEEYAAGNAKALLWVACQFASVYADHSDYAAIEAP